MEEQQGEIATESSIKHRKSKKLPVSLTEEEFLLLIKNTKQEYNRLAFGLGFCSGMRISEILKLRDNDVDFKERKIKILQGKGGVDRIVPLPKFFKEKHRQYLPIENYIGIRGLEKAFRTASKRAGLLDKKPDLHFHCLRHGFATTCLKKGMTLQDVRFFLGHANIATTSVYLHSEPTEVLKKYEELF